VDNNKLMTFSRYMTMLTLAYSSLSQCIISKQCSWFHIYLFIGSGRLQIWQSLWYISESWTICYICEHVISSYNKSL